MTSKTFKDWGWAYKETYSNIFNDMFVSCAELFDPIGKLEENISNALFKIQFHEKSSANLIQFSKQTLIDTAGWCCRYRCRLLEVETYKAGLEIIILMSLKNKIVTDRALSCRSIEREWRDRYQIFCGLNEDWIMQNVNLSSIYLSSSKPFYDHFYLLCFWTFPYLHRIYTSGQNILEWTPVANLIRTSSSFESQGEQGETFMSKSIKSIRHSREWSRKKSS